ncbi:UNVERIFIED_CONTAM: hypothetical protein DES50_102680 [Williamsia faeni]
MTAPRTARCLAPRPAPPPLIEGEVVARAARRMDATRATLAAAASSLLQTADYLDATGTAAPPDELGARLTLLAARIRESARDLVDERGSLDIFAEGLGYAASRLASTAEVTE